jgi:TonB-linked SusC/RagA family outer membrane protein
MQEVRHKLDVLNATDFAKMVNTARTNAGDLPLYTPAQIAAFGNGTNWQDVIFRKAPVQNLDLSVLGGDDDTKYFLSGGLLRQDGTVIGTNLNRGTFRVNFEQNVNKRLRFGNRISLSRSEGNVLPNGGNGNETSSIVLNALLAPPTLPAYTSSGEFFLGINNVTGRLFQNPLAAAIGITNHESDTRAIGNVYGEYDILGGLTLRSTLGADYVTTTQNYYAPSTILPGTNTNGYGSRGQLQLTTWLNENTLHYGRLFGNVHSVDLLGGLTFQKSNSENVSGTAQDFKTDNLRENGLKDAKTFVGVFTGAPHSSLLSYFSRINYGLAQRYLLTLSGRMDGSSKFGSGNQYALFPAAALAWRASEEDFVRRYGLFDDLKFRVSYGRTGNQDIGNYRSLATLGSTIYVIGGARAPGYVPNSLANPNLKWETTDQLDAGIDVAVLNNRVSLTADYYDKKTKDLLLEVPVPQTSGFTTVLQNIGSVGNHGFEVALNTVNLTGPLGWESSINFAWNRNKVLKLGVGSEIIGVGAGVGAGANQDPTIVRVGQPINSFYGWIYQGKDATGKVVYKDVNGDGRVTGADRVIIGNAQPNYTGGMTNDVHYGRFTLNAFIQWSVGNKIYNINRALLTTTAGDVNQLTDVLGNGRGIPTPKAGNTFETNPSDLFVEDGTYIRGKNIRLSYALPTAWFGQAHLTSLSTAKVYVGVTNFFTKTDYTGFDPEISEYSATNLAQGFDFGTYPQARTITFGFTAGF